MADFRKILSPKIRNLSKARLDRMLAFQEMDRPAMARSLLEASRILIDSNLLCDESQSARWDNREFLLYRCIPALAKRLDPAVELRADETPKPGDSWAPLFDINNDEVFLLSFEMALAHKELFRVFQARSDKISLAANFLQAYLENGSAIEVAIDTLFPGKYPAREQPDTREPLQGVQLIGTFGKHDRVLCYARTEEELEDLFRVAVAKRQGEDLSEEDTMLLRNLRSWPERLDFEALSIQSCDGTMMREASFLQKKPCFPEDVIPFP